MGKSTGKLVKEVFLILFALLVLLLFYFFFVMDYDCCANDPEPFRNKSLSQEEINQGKIDLGKRLFFDKRLSSDNTVSCMTCHKPGLAFTDGKQFSEGVEGRLGLRNSPTLLNLKDATTFMFDAEIKTLEEQAIVPIQDHNEMNMKMGDLIEKLSTNPDYAKQAKLLFDREFDALVLTESLAAFQRTLISDNSRFDRFYAGDASAITENELKGWKLFNDKGCIECHQLPHFTDYKAHKIGMLWAEDEDQGRFRVTHDSVDIGAFKTPSLRNISLTAPYLHNGSVENLETMLLLHRYGNLGLQSIELNTVLYEEMKLQDQLIIEFLKTLTDKSYLKTY